MTSVLDPDDRSTAVLFGDGAAATVLVADPAAMASAPAARPARRCLASSPPTWWVIPSASTCWSWWPAAAAPRQRRDGRRRRPPPADGRRRGVPARCGPSSVDRPHAGQGRRPRRRRPVRPSPGQRPHRRRVLAARASTPAHVVDYRPVRQHVGGVDPARLAEATATGTVAEGDLVLCAASAPASRSARRCGAGGTPISTAEIRLHEHCVAFVTGASGGIGSACAAALAAAGHRVALGYGTPPAPPTRCATPSSRRAARR